MAAEKGITIGFDLHMPLWSRIKLLFGVPLRVDVEGFCAEHINVSVCVKGEKTERIMSVR